jgi:hypothetical protein
MSGYIGSTPVPQATQHRESFTCTEGQTTFNTAGYTAQFVDVYLNGSHLSPADFTATNGSDVVLGVAASADDVCDIISYTPFEVADQTFTGTIDITGELKTTTLGTSNFRAGVNAGNSIASGGNYNVVVGDEAGTAITTGDQHVFVGYGAGDATTTSENNVAIGHNALTTNILSSKNVAVGSAALFTVNTATAVDSFNVGVGYHAGAAVTTGTANTLIGSTAGDALTVGASNAVLGRDALSADTKGSRAVAIGEAALQAQNFTSATENYNVAIGYAAGANVTTGTRNNLIGGQAGDALTDADFNTAIGYSLSIDTLGSRSTAVGSHTLINQNFTSATDTYNTVVGYAAGKEVTTGVNNTIMGGLAGDAITTGANNVCLGYQAGGGMTTGDSNILLGSGTARIAALTGDENIVIGDSAGEQMTSANNNIFIGLSTGVSSVAVTTGLQNILIGKQARVNAVDAENQITMGSAVTCEGNNNFTFGNGATDSNIAFGETSISAPSDERYKEDIATSTAGLSFIKDLRPVTFKWKKAKDVPVGHDAYIADGEEGCNDRVMLSNGETNHGFIAQEVKAAIDNHSELKDGFGMWTVNEKDTTNGRQRLADGALVPILVKAIQEQNALIEALTARITTLEG